LSIDFMVPNNPESRQVAEIIQAMAGEAGFDIKIRVTEFATSLKEAEEGRYQAYFVGWSGRVDPDGNSYIFHKSGTAEQQRLQQPRSRQVAGRGPHEEFPRRA